MNEAALLAARRGQDEVRGKDFFDALEKIMLGPERPILLSEEDRKRIAAHPALARSFRATLLRQA